MKKLLSLLVGIALVMATHAVWADDSTGNGSAVSTPAVSSTPVAKHKVKKTKKKAVVIAKKYVCPMDGYTSDKPGKCPNCGMDLVEPPTSSEATHSTDSTSGQIAHKTYVCPMDGYTSDQPGTCPKCGMGLVEKN